MRIPQPPAVFFGRNAELTRLDAGLREAPAALVFGVGGVGKSALVAAFAAKWRGPVVYHRIADDDAPQHVALDLLRSVGGAAPTGKVRIEGTLAELGERLDELGAMLVLDDIHRFSEAARAPFLRFVAESLVRARVVATSRERIGSPADGPERIEVHLGGLDEASAREVWAALDRLYGPSDGFESAWKRAHGNPYLLRRWHAGAIGAEDPVAASVRELSPDEHRVAAALALCEMRLPTRVLERFVARAECAHAVRALTVKLIVEIDAAGECTIHDLFRAALLDELPPEERLSFHEDLASLLADADLPPVERALEVCRHLRALDRHEAAGEYLFEHGADMVRHGGAWQLLRAIDAIPEKRRSVLVQISRVRTLGRVLDLDRAYEELARLVASGAEPRIPLQIAFGQLASITCHIGEARAALADVLAEEDLPPKRRLLVDTGWILLRAHEGEFEEARVFAERALRTASDPEHVGNLYLALGFAHWIEGDELRSEPSVRRALSHLADAPRGFRASFFARALLAGVAATLGRFDDAEEALRAAEAVLRDGDHRPRLEISAARGVILYERGAWSEAVELWRSVHEAMDRSGYVLGTLWVECLLGRAMLDLGWRGEALQLLTDAERRARVCGMISMARMAARARAHDSLAELTKPEADGSAPWRTIDRTWPRAICTGPKNPGRAARARALSAVRAAAAGDEGRALCLVEENTPHVGGVDHALDRAMAHLARAILARKDGDETLRAEAWARAVAEAEQGGVDPELVPAMDAALRGVTVVSARPPPIDAGVAPVAAGELIVDRRRHEVRTIKGHVSLGRRPMLRRLLYALADRPGVSVSREELAKRLWNATYHPLVHDNALLVNVSRLRAALAPVGLGVTYDEAGYRLDSAPPAASSRSSRTSSS